MADEKRYRYIPTICRKYNDNQSCTRDDCTHPHVCFKYFHPKHFCNRKGCDFNHDIMDPKVRVCLRKAGFNVSVKPGELRQAYVDALKTLGEERKKTHEAGGKPVSSAKENPLHIVNEIQRLTSALNLSDVPKVCLNYNQGICVMAQCPLLHICNDYVAKKCKKRFQDCPLGHDVLKADIKSKLSASGFNVNQKPKDLLDDYRAVIQGHVQTPPAPARQGQRQGEGSSRTKLARQGKSFSLANLTGQTEKVPRISANRSGSSERPVLSRTGELRGPGFESESVCSSDSEYDEDAPKKEEKKNKTRRGRGRRRQKGNTKESSPDRRSDQNPTSGKGIIKDIPHGGCQHPTASGKLHISPLEDADICLYYLNGKCTYGENCKHHHQDMPYLWQYKILQQGFKWKSFSKDNGQLLEQSFCNVDTPGSPVILEGQMFNVDFDSMIAIAKDINIPVRRLTTTSYVNEPEGQSFVTRWVWFWESDNSWVECGQKLKGDRKDVKRTQKYLEQGFLNNPTGETTMRIGGFPYKVDFRDMRQKNTKSGTERRLRRRPVFVSPEDVKNAPRLQKFAEQNAKGYKDIQLPAIWTHMKENEEVALVTLSEKDEEYKGIRDMFKRSLPNKKIRIAKRIQNPTLWLTFSVKRSKMEREYGAGNTNEMRLFHGTRPEAVDAICEQNFDWRLYGSSAGARFGKGAYFAIYPEKADQYVQPDENGLRFMFRVRVLVGKFTKGEKTMRRPPPIDPENPSKLYDTCANDPSNPEIFVAFDKEQYYPECIICYS